MEGVESWEVQASGRATRWTSRMLRDRLERGELLGCELARPVGATRWAPLVATALYRELYPSGSPRARALRAALATGWRVAAAAAVVLGAWGGLAWAAAVIAAWLVSVGPRVWRAAGLPVAATGPEVGDLQGMEVELGALRAAVAPNRLAALERARAQTEGPLAGALEAHLEAAREAARVVAELDAALKSLAHLEAAAELRDAVREGRRRVAEARARVRAAEELG